VGQYGFYIFLHKKDDIIMPNFLGSPANLVTVSKR